jgi:integrase
VDLFKKKKSKYWWYDFTVRDRRYRGSTKETNRNRASSIASLKLADALDGSDPLPKKAPLLCDFSQRFLDWVNAAQVEDKTRKYYRYGWQMLSVTKLAHMRLNAITNDDLETLRFPGGAANANSARRTLSRMLHKAEDWKLIRRAPKIKLLKEHSRLLRLDDDRERKLLAGAVKCNFRPTTLQRLHDAIVLMRDTGMRNERELFRLRVENIDWGKMLAFIPDSKTVTGVRDVPISDRAYEILRRRCGKRREGWVFASKHSKSGHLTTVAGTFRRARRKAGLPEQLVLYCARHDFGSRVLQHTGNLKLVMEIMGQKDVKTAMKYQHPEHDLVRRVLNETNAAASPPAA